VRVKICGITQAKQGKAIVDLGATALGFICVPQSPRYCQTAQIEAVVRKIPAHINRIGVFANASLTEIKKISTQGHLTGIQLHGNESPQFCEALREVLPQVELIKAFRIKTPQSLDYARDYAHCVDTLLLDAYHPNKLGGTGQTLNWKALAKFSSPLPWLLAGGLTPDNIRTALDQVKPDGIDLSSGVERQPGDKDLDKVAQLFRVLNSKRMGV
jgi:phosphoribosylanthranilate isomerase